MKISKLIAILPLVILAACGSPNAVAVYPVLGSDEQCETELLSPQWIYMDTAKGKYRADGWQTASCKTENGTFGCNIIFCPIQ